MIAVLERNQSEIVDYANTIGVDPQRVRWEPLYLPVFKDFDERFGTEVKKRIASGNDPGVMRKASNVDGESIRIAASRLFKRREVRKVMIVFSDGQPAANVHRPSLMLDLKNAVKEISAAGIEMVGIGIQDRSVLSYYPKSFVINNVADLATTTIRQLKEILAS
jgi:nitric oxide reductase activation protein